MKFFVRTVGELAQSAIEGISGFKFYARSPLEVSARRVREDAEGPSCRKEIPLDLRLASLWAPVGMLLDRDHSVGIVPDVGEEAFEISTLDIEIDHAGALLKRKTEKAVEHAVMAQAQLHVVGLPFLSRSRLLDHDATARSEGQELAQALEHIGFRDDPGQPSALDDWDAADPVLDHQLGGAFEAVRGFHGHHLLGHHMSDRGIETGLSGLGRCLTHGAWKPANEIRVCHDADELTAIDHRRTTDASLDERLVGVEAPHVGIDREKRGRHEVPHQHVKNLLAPAVPPENSKHL